MLELLFTLLLNLATLQTSGDKPAAADKASSGKDTTITTNKAGTNTSTGIGSGGWDPNN
jgi:hypothetical protein